MLTTLGNLAHTTCIEAGGWLVAALLAGSVGLAWTPQSLGRTLDGLRIDFRYALRSLLRRPGFAILAVALLATGIGVSVAVFSIADVILVRSLPFHDAGRLVELHGTYQPRGWRVTNLALPDVLDIRAASQTMQVAGLAEASFNLAGAGEPERVAGRKTTWNFFDVLGVRPLAGRTFSPDEEKAGNDTVAVITSGLWQRRFGSDPGAVGRTITLDGRPFTIVGVLPAGFWFEGRSAEIWTTFGVTGEESRSSRYLASVARLRPGSSLADARTEAVGLGARLALDYPDTNTGWSAGVRPLRELLYGAKLRSGGVIAAVAAIFVLLIACANVSNLLLARSAGRSRDLAVLAALGATPRRVAIQFVADAAVIAVVAGVLGATAALASARSLVAFAPQWLSQVQPVGVDTRTLLLSFAVTGLAGLFSAAIPAVRTMRAGTASRLKEGGRSTVTPSGGRLRTSLVVVEVALSLALMACSALLLQGLGRLQRTEWGWDADRVLSFKLALPASHYPSDREASDFYARLRSELAAVPLVESVGGIEILPLEGESNTFYNVTGQASDGAPRAMLSTRAVLPGYFEALRIPLLRGVPISTEMTADSRLVVVNRRLAERHWPGGDPVGQHITFWREDWEIVGVVDDTLDVGREARPMAFVAHAVLPLREMSLVVRTATPPAMVAPAVRQVVARLDPSLPVYQLATMREVMDAHTHGYSVLPLLMAVLTAVALLLGVGGVYGVVAYWVAQRHQEVGVRVALGAQHLDIFRLVLRQGLVLVGGGILVGLFLAAALSRSLALFLFGVSPFDVATFAGVAAALLAAGLAATVVPARRALNIDPVRSLKAD